MKPFKIVIKDILLLIAYIGPLLIIGLDNFNIIFKVIIAGITFLYNAFYYHRTSNIKEELSELNYKYIQEIKHHKEWQKKDGEYLVRYQKQLDIAHTENKKLHDELNSLKEQLNVQLNIINTELKTANDELKHTKNDLDNTKKELIYDEKVLKNIKDCPIGISFAEDNMPIYWKPNTEKPYGDYTVWYSSKSHTYHTDKYCASWKSKRTHIFNVIEKGRPCKKCAENYFDFTEVPDWFTDYKNLEEYNDYCY